MPRSSSRRAHGSLLRAPRAAPPREIPIVLAHGRSQSRSEPSSLRPARPPLSLPARQHGLFIGRFQPFHNGHLKAVQWMFGNGGCSSVTIGIGSSQARRTLPNPFSYHERTRMVAAALRAARLSRRCRIVPIPDINDNDRWVAHVGRHAPAYGIAYSNNPLVKRLFREAGKAVKPNPFFDRKNLEATKIRQSMAKGTRAWRSLVPETVAAIIERIKGAERVKALARTRR